MSIWRFRIPSIYLIDQESTRETEFYCRVLVLGILGHYPGQPTLEFAKSYARQKCKDTGMQTEVKLIYGLI